MNQSEIRKKMDPVLLLIIISMSVISILMIYSAMPLITSSSHTAVEILLKQGIWYVLGFITLYIVFKLGNDRVQSFIYICYWILLASLVLLLIQKYMRFSFLEPFISIRNETASWYQIIGVGTLQPSEFMKVVLIVLIPHQIDLHHQNHPISTMRSDFFMLVRVFKYVLPPVLLTYMQPDSGLTLIILFAVASMILIGGIHKEWVYIGLGSLAGLLLFIGILYLISPDFVIEYIIGGTYKLNRIQGWLHPENHILDYGNQLYTSLLAVGSAGLWGYGLQNIPLYVAEAQNDFIFATVASTFGLFGSLSVLLLSLSLDLRLLQIAMKTNSSKYKCIIAGLVGVLAFQQIENMGMIIGLFPITGITLPFISAGGSSLLSYMAILAVIMSIYSDIVLEEKTMT